MRSRLVLVVALALTGLPLFGQSNDVTLWVGSSRVGTTHSGGTDIHFDRGDSLGVSLNHFFSSRLSAELGVFMVRHDGSLRIGGFDAFNVGRLRMTPVTATLQWHLGHFRRLDAYVGPGLAYVRSDSLHSTDLDNAGVGRVKVSSRIGWTADAGVSFAVTQRFAVGGDARYIGYRPSSGPADSSVKLELSPMIYSLGLRWRF